MTYWYLGLVSNLLGLAVLLAVAGWMRRRVGWVRRLGIPDAFLAGGLGLALGPAGVGLRAFDTASLEAIVYHAFGLMYVAISLQRPAVSTSPPGSTGVRAVALAIPTTAILQILLGFLLVSSLAAIGISSAHPGLALMGMLGFSQGPGQALSLGSAWEPMGLPDGAQVGLGLAAAGFVACGAIGVPLVAWGRRRGLLETVPDLELQPAAEAEPPATSPTGVMDRLTGQVVAVATIYAATFGALWVASAPLSSDSPLRSTLWGFHFIVGALIAIATRRLARRARFDDVFDDRMLSRMSVVAVDFSTTAAVAALLPAVLGRTLVPMLVLSIGLAALSLVVSLWLARRSFARFRFEHAVAMFGAATGTLATGLALLRSVDPDLRTPAARNLALGAAASVPFMIPLITAVLPLAVSAWPRGWVGGVLPIVGILLLYLGALAGAWRLLTPLRAVRPWSILWPETRDE